MCLTDERTFSFKTRFFGTLALVQDKHINMPFQSWELRPRAANHALLTIIAAIVEVEFEILVSTLRSLSLSHCRRMLRLNIFL